MKTGVNNWREHVSDVLHEPFIECGNSVILWTDLEQHPVVHGENLFVFVIIA